ncbi:MAG: hypothetical protein IJJ45_09435 [Clostridia bacterium]|nr:hypothetical protein [Clostridia bacterium]
MKPDRSVLRETGRVAVGTLCAVAVMLAVYACIGRLDMRVALGGIYTGLLGVANFFTMGLTVQSIATRAAEKQRDEQELQAFKQQMENRMKLSRNGRMIALMLLIIAGIKLFGFDPLATILPIVFPSIVIRILQIIDSRKNASAKGSEEL